MSYRLHPSVLDDLGLVEALRAECDRVARHARACASTIDAARRPRDDWRPETSLCICSRRAGGPGQRRRATRAPACRDRVRCRTDAKGLQLVGQRRRQPASIPRAPAPAPEPGAWPACASACACCAASLAIESASGTRHDGRRMGAGRGHDDQAPRPPRRRPPHRRRGPQGPARGGVRARRHRRGRSCHGEGGARAAARRDRGRHLDAAAQRHRRVGPVEGRQPERARGVPHDASRCRLCAARARRRRCRICAEALRVRRTGPRGKGRAPGANIRSARSRGGIDANRAGCGNPGRTRRQR